MPHHPHLHALLGGMHLDLGPLVEGCPDAVPHQGVLGQLHGNHVLTSLQHILLTGELTGGTQQQYFRL